MLNLVDLSGKKIVVIGASQGIGRDTAIMISQLGAQVCLVSRSWDKLNESLRLLSGTGHCLYVMDVGCLDEIDEIVKRIISEFGMIDGLVYSAGITNDRPINLYKPEAVDKIIKVNLEGFMEVVRCFTKKGRYNRGMRIVGISSTAAIVGTRATMAYSAAKAGMNGAMRCMAVELAEKGITANTVAPGMISTDMYKSYLEHTGGEKGENLYLLGRQYLGIGHTTDVAAVISFLLCPASRFLTGLCIPVDGGLLSC